MKTTMKLDANEMMDYLDGTLDEAHRAKVEAHLAVDAEDRELMNLMRASMSALHELDEREPVRASDDFWIKVRNGLPSSPPRRSLWTQLTGALWPQPGMSASRSGLSLRVAVVACIIALMGVWFAPQQSIENSIAIPRDAEAFIKMATERHKAYVSSQPLSGAPVGDVTSGETGDEEDEPRGLTP
jgi:anti-sigma factor RsiW